MLQNVKPLSCVFDCEWKKSRICQISGLLFLLHLLWCSMEEGFFKGIFQATLLRIFFFLEKRDCAGITCYSLNPISCISAVQPLGLEPTSPALQHISWTEKYSSRSDPPMSLHCSGIHVSWNRIGMNTTLLLIEYECSLLGVCSLPKFSSMLNVRRSVGIVSLLSARVPAPVRQPSCCSALPYT